MVQTSPEHTYTVEVRWTGNRGSGTSGYRDYGREHEVWVDGKPGPLPGSADPAFRGDSERYNPEELLLAALSQCHLLAYLHVCVRNKIIVTDYADRASGTMITEGTTGRFTEVVLQPRVSIAAGDPELARTLHNQAHADCFIANSVNFPVRHEPVIVS